MMADLTELRREVEQVRNEVRRAEEPSKQSEKNAVLLSWLVETVKELQSELRGLETKVGDSSDSSDSTCDQAVQVRLLREEIEELQGREEENRLALQHLEKILEGEGKIKQNTKIGRPESSGLKQPRHLAKLYLRSWMAEMEASQQVIKDQVQQLQEIRRKGT